MLNEQTLQELKRLAGEATPGPWGWWTSNSTLRLTGADGRDGGVLYGYAHSGSGDVNCAPKDQAFIAAANPAAVLELVSEVERLRAAAEAPVVASTELENEIRKLTQWKHCMSYNDSYFTEPAGLVKRVAYQLERILDRAAAPASPAAPVPPWIQLGHGAVTIGQGNHEGIPAILFGKNGTGTVGEESEGDRFMEPGELLCAITFRNGASISVLEEKLRELRARIWPEAAAPVAPTADVKNPTDAESAEGGTVWGSSVAQAAAPVAPTEQRPTDDELWDATLRDRDTYHEWADKLAEAISKHFGAYIGEHSNTNCPLAEALEAIESAAPVAQPADERADLIAALRRDAAGGHACSVFELDRAADLIEQAATPAAPLPQQSEPVAYVATDLDGRFDVGRTPEEAKRRAGHGCDTTFPLFDIGDAGSAPASPVPLRPLPTPEQLLAVARDTGLRSYLHGVNATNAREILSTYIDAVRLLDTNYLPAPASTGPDGDDTAKDAGYQELFNAIAAATRIEGGAIAVSVKKFRAALSSAEQGGK